MSRDMKRAARKLVDTLNSDDVDPRARALASAIAAETASSPAIRNRKSSSLAAADAIPNRATSRGRTKRVDPKQRARRVVYAVAAAFLEELAAGTVRAGAHSLYTMAKRARVFTTDVWRGGGPDEAAIAEACRDVARELQRRTDGRGPYRKRKGG
jgi:hypothetical protein